MWCLRDGWTCGMQMRVARHGMRDGGVSECVRTLFHRPPSSILVSPAVLRHSIPHLYKHSPSLTNSHAHAYRWHASKASDIAHLDPLYSPTGTHHDHNQIYVDHPGKVHDPDFCLFVPTPMCVFTSNFKDDKDEDVSLYSMRQQPCRVSMPHCAPPIPCHTRPSICRSCVQ